MNDRRYIRVLYHRCYIEYEYIDVLA